MVSKLKAWSPKFEKMYEVTLIDFVSGDVGLASGNGSISISDLGSVQLVKPTEILDSSSEPVMIYEGDIVKRTSLIPGGTDMVGVVRMLEGCWVINDGTQAIPLWSEVDYNIVIGNIHENSGSLEGVSS